METSHTTAAKKILIVEDEAPMMLILTDRFKKERMTILQAKDGVSGLTMAMSERPDIILLDILLPMTDGLVMLKKLRTESGSYGKTVPVILLTNLSADSEVINRAIADYEPAYYLVKTECTPDMIAEKVKERLERR